MKAHLNSAYYHARQCQEALRLANASATAVESMILLRLITEQAAIHNQIVELENAICAARNDHAKLD